MNREVVQPWEQQTWDRQQQLDQRLRVLLGMDAELVEWTLSPARPEGKHVTASLLLTDHRRPLEQLAGLLRRVADEVERLHRPRGSAAALDSQRSADSPRRKAA